jgi:hypothetical protein
MGSTNKAELARIVAPRVPRLAFSIAEFCAANSISIPMYLKIRGQGLGPREMRVGTRVLISVEAAEKWRREREKTTS